MFNSRIEKSAAAMTADMNLDDIKVIVINGEISRDYMNRITLNGDTEIDALPVWDITSTALNVFIERRMIKFIHLEDKWSEDLFAVARKGNYDDRTRAVILYNGKLVVTSGGKTDILPCIINI